MNKKVIFAIVALVALIGIFLGVYVLTRPETQQGSKQIRHRNSSLSVFSIITHNTRFLQQHLDQPGFL